MHWEDAAFFDSAAPTRWFAWENPPTVGPQAPEELRYLYNRLRVEDFYNMAGGFGHMGIGVNTNQTVGLYPVEPTLLDKLLVFLGFPVPGQVLPNNENLPHSTIIYNTTPAQDEAIQSYINQETANPPEYELYKIGGTNCAGLCEGTLNSGNLPSGTQVIPNSLYKALQSEQAQ